MRHLLEKILPEQTTFQDFIVDKTIPHIGRKVLILNGRRLEQVAAQPDRIFLAMEEVTGRMWERKDEVEAKGERSP